MVGFRACGGLTEQSEQKNGPAEARPLLPTHGQRHGATEDRECRQIFSDCGLDATVVAPLPPKTKRFSDVAEHAGVFEVAAEALGAGAYGGQNAIVASVHAGSGGGR